MNPDLRLAAVAARQRSAFSRGQAYAAGFTPPMVRNRLELGRWGEVFPDAFRLAGSEPTWEQRLWAAWLAAGPNALVSRWAAARLWEVPDVPPSVNLALPRGGRTRLAGVDLHRATWDRVDVATREGLPVVSATLMILQLAAITDAETLGPVLDHCLNRRLTTPTYIERRLAALGRQGRPGVAVIDQLLAARPIGERRPDPGLEPRLLALLGSLKGPPPVTQHRVVLPSGREVYLDIAWPDDLLAIEADSYLWHASRTDWSRDQTRRNELIALGWRILPVTAYDVDERPEWILRLVTQARTEKRGAESAS